MLLGTYNVSLTHSIMTWIKHNIRKGPSFQESRPFYKEKYHHQLLQNYLLNINPDWFVIVWCCEMHLTWRVVTCCDVCFIIAMLQCVVLEVQCGCTAPVFWSQPSSRHGIGNLFSQLKWIMYIEYRYRPQYAFLYYFKGKL